MANKCDEEDERKVSSAEVKEFAEREGLIYVGECSAKEDINI